MKHLIKSSIAVAAAICTILPTLFSANAFAFASEKLDTEAQPSTTLTQSADTADQGNTADQQDNTANEETQETNDQTADNGANKTPVQTAQETVYPDVSLFSDALTFSVLHDFNVKNDVFALAGTVQNPTSEAEKNNGFYLYQNGSYTFHASPSQAEILQLEYDADGILYFSDGQNTYRYPDNSLATHTFSGATLQVTISPYYYFITGGSLYILNQNEPTQGAQNGGSGFTKLVQQNGNLYALQNNAIMQLNGTEQTAVTFDYVNYERATGISVGNTFTLLQQLQTVQFVNIAEGSYVTPVDLTASAASVDGTFVVDKTYCTSREIRMALLLCTTGNAWLYATKDGCFLTPVPENAAYNPASTVAKNEQDYVNAACAVYSAPYISESTRLASVALSSAVTVTGLIECQTYTNLTSDWYIVNLTDEGGQTVQGYIPAGYIYGYSFNGEKNSYTAQNPTYSEANMLRTAFWVMVVVILVLLLFGYIVSVATRRPREKKRRDKQTVAQSSKKN